MKMPDPAPPLILTLTMDAASQARFDALRAAHFPPDRLVVGAHVTLFHALPGDLAPEVAAVLADQAARTPPLPMQVAGVRLLGRGVAFGLAAVPGSTRLAELRDRLRLRWADRLTPQDRQPWRPHVTIQNKVEPAQARALHSALSAGFVPYTVTATGLALWFYRNGPWKAAGTFRFEAPLHTDS